MAEQGPVGQTQEGNAQAMEAGTCGLEREQGCCSDVQGWDQENHDTAGVELRKDIKNNKKGFDRYISLKSKTKESIPPLINRMEKLLTADMEKAEAVSIIFASVFTGSHSSHISQVPEPIGRVKFHLLAKYIFSHFKRPRSLAYIFFMYLFHCLLIKLV